MCNSLREMKHDSVFWLVRAGKGYCRRASFEADVLLFFPLGSVFNSIIIFLGCRILNLFSVPLPEIFVTIVLLHFALHNCQVKKKLSSKMYMFRYIESMSEFRKDFSFYAIVFGCVMCGTQWTITYFKSNTITRYFSFP